jgi:hypothetical protein
MPDKEAAEKRAKIVRSIREVADAIERGEYGNAVAYMTIVGAADRKLYVDLSAMLTTERAALCFLESARQTVIDDVNTKLRERMN